MILAVLTGLAMIQQAPEPAAMRLNLKPLWRAPGPVRVPIGDDVTTATLQLPPLPHAPGQRLIIRFRARLTTTAFGGWNEYLALVVNGQVAGPRTVEGVLRLINRPPFWRADYRGKRWMSVWENRNGYPCLNVWFSHTYDQMDPRVLDPAGELYWYALDITDLAQRDKPNEIKLVNTALARYFGGADKVKDVFLEVDSLEVGVAGARDVEIIRARREVVRRPLRGPSAVGSGWSALACPGGGIQIRAAGQHFYIETSYRVLGQQLELRCQPEPLGWDVRTSAGGGSLQVLAHADRLEVRRTVTPAAHRLIIEDQVANRTHNDLGVVVEHTAIASSPFRAVRLMGQDTAAVSPPWGAENCTVHARTDHAGLGILVLDDFFRCHFSALTQDNWILLADEHFALAAGESYRFRLAVYPATGDRAAAPTAVQEAPTSYWVFLNQVRRDIGANFTIDGPFEFLDSRSELVKDARKLRAYLARKPVRLFALSPWLEYYNGAQYSRAEYKALLQEAAGQIKKACPDAACLAMLETNLVSVPVRWFKGTLPEDWGYGHYEKDKKWGQYGIAPPPEARRIIEESPWADSMLRDDQGRPLLDTWYIPPPYGFVNLMVYPRAGNYREQHMLDQIRFVLDEVGLDGCYIDQFTMSRGTHAYDYGRWDGHTVDIDPETGQIVRRYAYVAVASASSRRRLVQEILRRGKTVVTNGPAASWRLQDLPIYRFMETQGYNVEGDGIPDQPVLATGQLGSPIGLGHQWQWHNSPQAGRYFVRTIVAHLRYGLTYYYYGTTIPDGAGSYEIVTHMFPITPVQLGEGFIVGKERVVTCVSKSFRLPWAREPRVLFFDETSRPRKGRAQITGSAGDWIVRPAIADFREVAIIE